MKLAKVSQELMVMFVFFASICAVVFLSVLCDCEGRRRIGVPYVMAKTTSL